MFERGKPYFPRRLEASPFEKIYCEGNHFLLHALLTVGVVGSRNASREGLADAYDAGRAVVHLGGVLVTGLAVGVDASAVAGALDCGGHVIGVRPWLAPLGGENPKRVLQHGGCIVSHVGFADYAMRGDERWVNRQFFLRNMLIAYLSDVVLVIEPRLGGGSMHMVEALRRGRRVCVLKPKVEDYAVTSACGEYVKNGAPLVESVEAFLERVGKVHQ